jgi:hypothetical protein
MSNSFKNIQNKLSQFKKEMTPDEPGRRKEGLRYLDILGKLSHTSYHKESVSDYMFIRTITDSITEVEYFGGFSIEAKERLRIIEKRYNYIHEEDSTDI